MEKIGASKQSSRNPSNKNPIDESIALYGKDARLFSEYHYAVWSGKPFDYYTNTKLQQATQVVAEEEITTYLSKMQRGGFIQNFGCMIAIEESSFKIIGFSENCFIFLDVEWDGMIEAKLNQPSIGLIGVDARILFTPSSQASLEKNVGSREIPMSNPIWVHTRTTHKPFYAILHRIDVGVVIDLEPANVDASLLFADAMQSQEIIGRAISRLQSLPGGDIQVTCDTVAEQVQNLTGYDRVMIYKFHDDQHGEVVSEVKRAELEPFLGLHFPATDIPQAARFLFKQNRTRMIANCYANGVKVIQSEALHQPLCLVNSTLRAPHGCHSQYMANMGSIGSLVMAILVNNNNESLKLWGLVVCHHTSPRYTPYPLRSACEILIKVMGLQLYMELQLAEQKAENRVLYVQTRLCDLLLREGLLGIVTQSPNVMDLVKCDGAALCYQGNVWLLGATPTEAYVVDIVEWLLSQHGDSTGLSTESLLKAGYPGAAMLSDVVCGMVAIRIASRDYLLWFRSHLKKEINWGGGRHLPLEKEEGEKMHPRSSFKAFLEAGESQSKSLTWEVFEINAIHALQLIMGESIGVQ